MSVVIYWHPGAPWGVCLKSLYYCSGSTLVVVDASAESVKSSLGLWYFEILPKTELWKRLRSYPHINKCLAERIGTSAELYSTHQYGRVIFYTSIWQSYILHINMAELYSTHQYGRVIFYTSIWQSYILHINMAELYSTHQYGRVIFYTSIWQSYNLHINISMCWTDQDVFTLQCNEYSLYNEITHMAVKPRNPDIHVYRYTNVLQNNWAAFNKHHASTEVDLTYENSSLKPWWMPHWSRGSGLDRESDDI